MVLRQQLFSLLFEAVDVVWAQEKGRRGAVLLAAGSGGGVFWADEETEVGKKMMEVLEKNMENMWKVSEILGKNDEQCG